MLVRQPLVSLCSLFSRVSLTVLYRLFLCARFGLFVAFCAAFRAFSAIDSISFVFLLSSGCYELIVAGGAECARLVFDVPVKRMLNANQRLHHMTKAARSKWLR